MPTNGSIVITRQVENLREAASLARDLATSVAAVLHEQLLPFYEEGETPIDFELLQKVAGRWIDARNDGLSDAQYQRQHLRNLKRHFRELAKEAADELRDVLVDVRFQLDRTLGVKATNSYFEGRGKLTRLSVEVIERVSNKLLMLYEDPKFGWDQVSDPSRRSVNEANRIKLTEGLAKLRAAIADTRPESNALLHSTANFKREYLGKGGELRRAVSLLGGLYSSAGFDLEAANLRPARVRRRPTPTERMMMEPPSSLLSSVLPPATPVATPEPSAAAS